jgi:hypothetical protein
MQARCCYFVLTLDYVMLLFILNLSDSVCTKTRSKSSFQNANSNDIKYFAIFKGADLARKALIMMAASHQYLTRVSGVLRLIQA